MTACASVGCTTWKFVQTFVRRLCFAPCGAVQSLLVQCSQGGTRYEGNETTPCLGPSARDDRDGCCRRNIFRGRSGCRKHERYEPGTSDDSVQARCCRCRAVRCRKGRRPGRRRPE